MNVIYLGLLHGTNSKPVNIPTGSNFSPSSHPNSMFITNDSFIPNLSGSAGSSSKLHSNSFGHGDSLLFNQSSHLVSSLNDRLGSSISPDLR